MRSEAAECQDSVTHFRARFTGGGRRDIRSLVMDARSPVDLRSDTVTRPTPAMRRAMAEAVVGDDVFGDDPTVAALERRVAELAGKEAAVFVPSGTMANQIAVLAHTRPGDEVLLESRSHLFMNEQGGIAANAGCLARTVPGARGVLDPAELQAAVRDASDDHVARLALVCVENTHNGHGGTVVPLAALDAVRAFGRAHGIAVHLDGARLWNASVASGVPIRRWAETADTLSMCFSKGLGAPVGSILVGDGAAIAVARRARKRLGGSMRQVGVLAAACLHALDHHVERLADDHRRARTVAERLGTLEGVRAETPETNMVRVTLEDPRLDRDRLAADLAPEVLIDGPDPRMLRIVTHLDVDDAGLERAVEALSGAVRARLRAAVDAPGPAC